MVYVTGKRIKNIPCLWLSNLETKKFMNDVYDYIVVDDNDDDDDDDNNNNNKLKYKNLYIEIKN